MKDFTNILAAIATLLDMIVAGVNFAQGNLERATFFLVLAIIVWIMCIITPAVRDKDNQ